MAEPRIYILGAYKVPVTRELFEEALELKYGGGRLSRRQRKAAERAVREELSNILLIEAEVSDADDSFDAGDFSQGDQVAYDEAYLSEDGESVVLKGFDKPSVSSFRIAFFLHFCNPDFPITSSYGSLTLPPVQEMPERLARLMPYEPVD